MKPETQASPIAPQWRVAPAPVELPRPPAIVFDGPVPDGSPSPYLGPVVTRVTPEQQMRRWHAGNEQRLQESVEGLFNGTATFGDVLAAGFDAQVSESMMDVAPGDNLSPTPWQSPTERLQREHRRF